jgi:hypothetical protein
MAAVSLKLCAGPETFPGRTVPYQHIMSKTRDSKKQTKKAPLKSAKEKRLAKREKKAR